MALSFLKSGPIFHLLAAVLISAMVLEKGADFKLPQQIMHGDGKYFLYVIPVGFTQAQRFCEMAQASFVAVQDEDKNVQFIKLIEQFQENNGRILNPWIGGRRNNTHDSFVWVATGEVFDYTNWPANSNEGDKAGCVYYERANDVEGWKWHVGDCNSMKLAICEYS